jgi:hypothetical protein
MSAAALILQEYDPLKDLIVQRTRVTMDGCWFWEGPVTSDGRYGNMKVTRLGEQMAHRVSYIVFVGPIPDGLTIDHLCGNTRCVNPAHLEAVTMRENIMRGAGVGALNARKTRCMRGHEFTDANTYRFPDGRRGCRQCRAMLRRRYYERTGT